MAALTATASARLVPFVDVPVDILHCIFACFILRARVLVLTRVCRRWRSAVLAMPLSLKPSLPSRHVQNLLLSGANIVSMGWAHLPPDLALPPLRSFVGYPDSSPFQRIPKSEGHNCVTYGLLTSLTSLRFADDSMCACLSHLLRNSAESLTSVDLTMRSERSPALADVASVRLLRLVDLRIELSFRDTNAHASLIAFMATHAAQLTRLSVAFRELDGIMLDALLACKFPLLTDLRLALPQSAFTLLFAQRLVACAPVLSELRVDVSYGGDTVLSLAFDVLAPFLVGLTYHSEVQAPTLAKLTRLRELSTSLHMCITYVCVCYQCIHI